MDREYLRTGDKAKIRFRFLYWPEYVKEGARLIFREGRTKGIGRITRVIPKEEELGVSPRKSKNENKEVLVITKRDVDDVTPTSSVGPTQQTKLEIKTRRNGKRQ